MKSAQSVTIFVVSIYSVKDGGKLCKQLALSFTPQYSWVLILELTLACTFPSTCRSPSQTFQILQSSRFQTGHTFHIMFTVRISHPAATSSAIWVSPILLKRFIIIRLQHERPDSSGWYNFRSPLRDLEIAHLRPVSRLTFAILRTLVVTVSIRKSLLSRRIEVIDDRSIILI